MNRLIVCAGLACGALTLFVACGGSDSKGATSTPAPKATAASTTAATGAASTVASATTASKPPPAGRLPADACALLTTTEVSSVLPAAGVGKTTSESGGPGQTIVGCEWSLETEVGTLHVTVATMFAGISSDELKASYRAEAKDFGRVLDGVGDFAIVTSAIAADAEVKALSGTLLLDIELQHAGAKDDQDKVIALAKAMIGRL